MRRLLYHLADSIRVQWRTSLTAFFVIVAFLDIFLVDISTIAAIFLGLAALPWLLHLFESIELPGGVSLKMRQVEEKLDASASRPTPADFEPFRYLSTNDPNLALVGLRIEIERRLRKIMELHGFPVEGRAARSLPGLLSTLAERGLISNDTWALISDVLPTLHKAAHGVQLPEGLSEWVLQNGPKLLALLDASKPIEPHSSRSAASAVDPMLGSERT